MGVESNKPQDWITGKIKVNGEVVSTMSGSYLGFFDVDGERFYDVRDAPEILQKVTGVSFNRDEV